MCVLDPQEPFAKNREGGALGEILEQTCFSSGERNDRFLEKNNEAIDHHI